MLKIDDDGRNSARGRFRRGACCTTIVWAVLAAILPMPGTALAASATLLTHTSICQNPSDSISYEWAKQKFGAAALFFMKEGGSVVPLTQDASFNSFDPVYITAHGEPGMVGEFGSESFAKNFKAEHESPPVLAYFNSCAAGVPKGSSGSSLKVFAAAYEGKVKTLRGPAGDDCQLTGNGESDLKKAELRYGGKESDEKTYNQIQKNIVADWDSTEYAKEKSYKAACKALMTDFAAEKTLTFVKAVITRYTTAAITPISKSFNYLELIRLNIDGEEPFTCGANHKQPCP